MDEYIKINKENRQGRALQIALEKLKKTKIMDYKKELYLYGSMARGEATWRSDVDLFLVLDEAGRDNRELKKLIIYLKGNLTEDDMEAAEIDLKVVFGDAWKESNQVYYRNILREGKRIW